MTTFEPLLRLPPFPGAKRRRFAPMAWQPDAAERIAAARAAVPAGAALLERAGRLADAIVTHRVGGAFWQPPLAADGKRAVHRPPSRRDALTLAGQGSGALAILPAARWSRGVAAELGRAGVAVMIGEIDPWPILDSASSLSAAGDDPWLAFAVLAGVPALATTDGPFASGLDRDRFAAAVLLDAALYRCPFTGAAIEPEACVGLLADWRRQIVQNRAIGSFSGIARWKRREVARMLWAPREGGQRFLPVEAARAAPRGDGVALWPSRVPAETLDPAAWPDRAVFFVEDGFLRSAGLGSGLHPPLSVTLDGRAPHFDSGRPSDLEAMLAQATVSSELRTRATALIATIVAARLGKYGAANGRAVAMPEGRRRVLVTGQVEDDLSLRFGGGDVAGNLDLLRRARAAEPDAWILYKPHPDVEAGHRIGHVADADALAFADAVERSAPIGDLLPAIDAVHVISSLSGFEALLRGREVVVHGAPFYAGWGLTRDLGPPLPRRGMTRTLAELVAVTLILYPRYLDPLSGMPCPPEILVNRLSGNAAKRHGPLTVLRAMQGRLRRIAARMGDT